MCLTEFSDEFIHDVFYDEGHAEGLAEGRTEGIDSINALNKTLVDSGRIDDLKRTIEDKAYQNQLLNELVYQQQG